MPWRLLGLALVVCLPTGTAAIAHGATSTLPGRNGGIAVVARHTLTLVSSGGSRLRTRTGFGGENLSSAPDGHHLAYDQYRGGRETGTWELYVATSDASKPRRITSHPTATWEACGTGVADTHPSWSPDGRQLVFQSERAPDGSTACDRTWSLWLVDADGTNLRPLTIPEDNCAGPSEPNWSSTRRIAFVWSKQVGVEPYDPGQPKCFVNVYSVSADGSDLRQVTRFKNDPFAKADVDAYPPLPSDPEWSPNGERLLFSYRDTRYVITAGGTGLARLGNYYDTWAPDGKRIALIAPQRPLNPLRFPNAELYTASFACAEAVARAPKYFAKPTGTCRSLKKVQYLQGVRPDLPGFLLEIAWQPLR